MTEPSRPAAEGPAPQPRIALLTWGHVLEDFLDPNGLSIDDFCRTFTGSWIFGYARALREASVDPLIVSVTTSVRKPTWTVHEPSGTHLCLLPPPRPYVLLRRWMRSGYGRTVLQSFGGSTPLRLLLYPLLFLAKETAAYASTPPWRLSRLFRRHGVRSILCQEYEFPRFDMCVLLGRLLRVPVYATFQGGDYQRWKAERLTRPLSLRFCSGVVVGPSGEAARVQSTYGVPVAKIARIPNPIDLDVWRPHDRTAAREALGISTKARVVAWHGRVQLPKKGLDLLVEAWARLCLARPGRDLRLLLVGSGEDADELRRRITARALSNVVWVDRLLHDQRQIAFLLSAADAYVFPSRHEGFPLAPIEAMACGLPVVAADASGIRDILPGNARDNGLIVPVGDARALALALGWLIDDPVLSRELGHEAHRRAADFGLKSTGERLRDFLVPARAPDVRRFRPR